ncbi:hypothetical protein GIB67_039247 [Kingdonia uniflora]|uniref:FAD/NAD(P)-binding domain-containing protein n=1 Tax=Kingdonia uniflora TaxID=39325 RepID=A0A7J7MLZ8_9MAGN|nr:hypothetical protein GIB67_039247 [Kingdonia uniflora]
MPIPILIAPTYYGMSEDEAAEAEEDFYWLVQALTPLLPQFLVEVNGVKEEGPSVISSSNFASEDSQSEMSPKIDMILRMNLILKSVARKKTVRQIAAEEIEEENTRIDGGELIRCGSLGHQRCFMCNYIMSWPRIAKNSLKQSLGYYESERSLLGNGLSTSKPYISSLRNVTATRVGAGYPIYCETISNSRLPQEPYWFIVAYDNLVIAAGAEPLTFNINGVKEHAYFLREVNHAQEIRKRLLLNLIFSENLGGGLTGVEFRGKLSDFIMKDNEMKEQTIDFSCFILEQANEILSSFDIGLRQYATKHLTKCGVHQHGIHLKKGVVKEVHPKKIVLSDGTDVPYGLLVPSTRVGPSDFVNSLNLPQVPGIGIDEWMRVPSVEGVFVLGDCAGFLKKIGRQILPALAQIRFLVLL